MHIMLGKFGVNPLKVKTMISDDYFCGYTPVLVMLLLYCPQLTELHHSNTSPVFGTNKWKIQLEKQQL